MKGAESFHPNPQARKKKMEGSKKDAAEDKDQMDNDMGPAEPAHSVHMFNHGDGSYSSATHHADGTVEHAEHPDHEHAKKHHAKVFHEADAADASSQLPAME